VKTNLLRILLKPTKTQFSKMTQLLFASNFCSFSFFFFTAKKTDPPQSHRTILTINFAFFSSTNYIRAFKKKKFEYLETKSISKDDTLFQFFFVWLEVSKKKTFHSILL